MQYFLFRFIQQALGDTFDDYLADLQMLTGLIDHLKENDKDGIYDLEVQNLSYTIPMEDLINELHVYSGANTYAKEFKRMLVIPSVSVQFWKNHLRQIMTLDACHMYGRFDCVCNLLVAVDANNQLFPLGYSITKNEDGENWKYTARHAFAKLNPISLAISDRDKGLAQISSLENVPLPTQYANCAVHMAKNAKFSKAEDIPLVTELAKCCTLQEYDKCLQKIAAVKPESAAYLDERKELFCLLFMQSETFVTNYGVVTSNAAEQMNNVLKQFRDMPFAAGILWFLEYLQKMILERKEASASMREKTHTVAGNLYPQVKVTAQKMYDASYRFSLQSFDPETEKATFLISLSGASLQYSKKVALQPNATHWADRIECLCQKRLYGYPCWHAAIILRFMLKKRCFGVPRHSKQYFVDPKWRLWSTVWYAPALHVETYFKEYSEIAMNVPQPSFVHGIKRYQLFPPPFVPRKGRHKKRRHTSKAIPPQALPIEDAPSSDAEYEDDEFGVDVEDKDPYAPEKTHVTHLCTGCGKAHHDIRNCAAKDVAYMVSKSSLKRKLQEYSRK